MRTLKSMWDGQEFLHCSKNVEKSVTTCDNRLFYLSASKIVSSELSAAEGHLE